MNKIGAGIIAFIATWVAIPIFTGIFLGVARLLERVSRGYFNFTWTWVFVLSVGGGILGSMYIGAKIWLKLTEDKK